MGQSSVLAMVFGSTITCLSEQCCELWIHVFDGKGRSVILWIEVSIA